MVNRQEEMKEVINYVIMNSLINLVIMAKKRDIVGRLNGSR